MRTKATGFTLVELMITVAVLTILIAIAYPLYQDQVRKSRRGAVKGSMLQISQFMERHYTENMSFGDSGGNSLTMSDVYNASFMEDASAVEEYYTVSITSNTTGFTIQAVPKSGQDDDKCKSLTITSAGVKSSSSNYTNCW